MDDEPVSTVRSTKSSAGKAQRGAATPFLGSAAAASGRLTSHQLRTRYRRLFPDVYIEETCSVTPEVLVRAAALWAPAGSVLVDPGAALMHRERWYAKKSVLTEVDFCCTGTPRSTPGVRLRRHDREFPAGHLVWKEGIRMTSVARSAVDVARWETNDDVAIAKIDAVCNRGEIKVRELPPVLDQMDGLHGVGRVRALLRWCDERADSPPETRLRLMLIRAGLPKPTPQLKIFNEYGAKIATADLGYEKQKVAIFYDSELHREKSNWEFDNWVNAQLAELGWERFRVTAQMMRNPGTLLRQIGSAIVRRDPLRGA